MLRPLALALATALLSACAATAPDTEQAETTADAADASKSTKLPERALPDDSLYPLLVAEFAIRRGAYDVALENYVELSPGLRDAGIAEHTTRLSQFMQQEPEALEASQLWVELDPDNAEANSILANLLVRQGRTIEAIPHLAVVERQGHSAHFPMLLNGFGNLNTQQRAELTSGINDLAREFPQSGSILLAQALLHAELKQYDDSLQKLNDLFKLEPHQEQALLLEANILLEQQAARPFAHIEQVLKEEPENKLLRMQYARLLTAVDMTAARKQFEILSAQSPRDGDMLFSLALINRELGDQIAASAYLRQVIALQQRVDEAYYYLGRIAEERGDTQEAIDNYRQVSGGREFLAANSQMGQLLIDGDSLENYHQLFTSQRVIHPAYSEQLFGLEAEILSQSGFSDEALGILDQSLAQSPLDSSLRYARAMLLEQQGDLAGMERDLRTILASEPDNATALNALGYTLADRTNRHAEALELISRALSLEPDEPAILDSMGWVLYRTGRYHEAIEYLTRAYTNFPDPEVAAHLGEVLWVTGQTDAARSVWQGAAQRSPDHPILRSTLERLGVGPLTTSGPKSTTPGDQS